MGTVKHSGEKQITFELSNEGGNEQKGDISFAMEWNGGNKAEHVQRLRYGVTAGLNSYGFDGNMFGNDNPPSRMGYAGFQVGVLADYAFSKRFSITPELLFTQRGERFSFSGDAFYEINYGQGETINEVRFTLNYLSLPVNLTYNYAFSDAHKILIFTGLYLSYGINVITRINDEKIDDGPEFRFSDSEGESNFKVWDIGWNIGVGYQYKKAFFKAQLNVGEYNILYKTDGSSAKNDNVAFTFGYLF